MIPGMRSVRRPSVRLPERADGHPCRNHCVNTRNVLRETREGMVSLLPGVSVVLHIATADAAALAAPGAFAAANVLRSANDPKREW